jgi:elongation factor Ts
MAITAKDVMALRNRTGLGMMECKKALADAEGDVDQAVALLRERVGGKIDERQTEAGEGAIAAAIEGSSVAMLELQSETDFAARNEKFIAAANALAKLALHAPDISTPTPAMKEIVENLRMTIKENIKIGRTVKLTGEKVGSYVHHNGKLGAIVVGEGELSDDLLRGISQHLIAADGRGALAIPLAVDEAGLPAEALQQARTTAIEEAQASGKPAQIAEKIATGKVRKWVDDHTLMGQVYVREMDAKKPIRDYLPKGGKITAFARFAVGVS